MAVTNSSATVYSNQKKLVMLSTNRLVAVVANTTTNAQFLYSDDGSTWTDYASDIAGWTNGSISAYVDSGGIERLVAVWKQSGTGGSRTSENIYAMVGSFNAGRTTLTWGTAQVVEGSASTSVNYPDVAVTPDGTGGLAFVVTSWADTTPRNAVLGWPITINSSGVPSVGSTNHPYPFNGGGVNVHTFPSIDINLTDKRLHVAWSAGTTGTGKGIRYRTASYSAGVWTWATEVEVDTGTYLAADHYTIKMLWDGTRAVIVVVGLDTNGTTYRLAIYDSTSFTAFTTRVNDTSGSGETRMLRGSAAIDSNGHVYVFGQGNNYAAAYQKATRSGATLSLGSRVELGPDYGALWGFSAIYANSAIRWIYTAGNNNPYQVKYDRLLV